MTRNGQRRRWRLILRLPDGYSEDTAVLFGWLRDWLIPAILHSPVHVTLELRLPDDESDRPIDETS